MRLTKYTLVLWKGFLIQCAILVSYIQINNIMCDKIYTYHRRFKYNIGEKYLISSTWNYFGSSSCQEETNTHVDNPSHWLQHWRTTSSLTKREKPPFRWRRKLSNVNSAISNARKYIHKIGIAFRTLVLGSLGQFRFWKWYLRKEDFFAVLVVSFTLAFDHFQKLVERILKPV